MSWILGLLGIPAILKKMNDLQQRVEQQEREIEAMHKALRLYFRAQSADAYRIYKNLRQR